MRVSIILVLCLGAAALHAASVHNDDSCDIAVLPAATLLLPYFEVDFRAPSGVRETTVFTITNTTNLPQAVQVTLWTDYDYPVLAFNIFLTGYDVQSINLYDVIARGRIAPDAGTGFDISWVGELSGDDYNQIMFDNPVLAEATCVDLPMQLPAAPAVRQSNPDYAVSFERTFYARFQSAAAPKLDGRQPLPATFAARWISGGPAGFQTLYKIWREGRAPSGTPCSAYPAKAALNFVEMVRFDEEENPETSAPDIIICTPIPFNPTLHVTSLTQVDDESVFPPSTASAVGGWLYMNLDYCNRDEIAGQNWVVTSMRAEGRFSVDIDTMALGNGCSAPITATEATGGLAPLGPAPNVRP